MMFDGTDTSEGTTPRVGFRDKLQAYFEATNVPVTRDDVRLIFGSGALDALDGLVFDGLVQRRKTFTKGRPYQHIAAGKEWPPHVVSPIDAARRKSARDAERKRANKPAPSLAFTLVKLQRAMTASLARAQKLGVQAATDQRKPWPFYDEKFLPYVRFMDAKMKRRYVRTAEIYGHQLPKDSE